MIISLGRFASDHALLIHGYLLLVAVFSTWIVAKGILFEHGPLDVRDIADKLVVWGVIAEAVCTIALFVVDESISRFQQASIDAQQIQLLTALDRATDADFDATVANNRVAEAEEALVAYRAQRHLSEEQKARLAEVTKKYPSVSFVAATAMANEPWIFVLELSRFLQKDGWTWLPAAGLQPNDGSPSEGISVLSHIQINASPAQSDAAHALREAILEPKTVGMDHVDVVITPNTPVMAIIVGNKE